MEMTRARFQRMAYHAGAKSWEYSRHPVMLMDDVQTDSSLACVVVAVTLAVVQVNGETVAADVLDNLVVEHTRTGVILHFPNVRISVKS
jgi:hypothetical protein